MIVSDTTEPHAPPHSTPPPSPARDSEGGELEDPTAWLLQYGDGPGDDPKWKGKSKAELIKARSVRKQRDLLKAHPNRLRQHRRENSARTRKCRKVRYKIVHNIHICAGYGLFIVCRLIFNVFNDLLLIALNVDRARYK